MRRLIFAVMCILTLCVQIHSQDSIHVGMYDTQDPCILGETTVYVIMVRNEGARDASKHKLEGKIPSKMEFVDAKGPSPFKVVDGSVIFEEIPVLKKGVCLQYEIMCKSTSLGYCKLSVSVQTETIFILQQETTSISKNSTQKLPALHFGGYDTEDPCYANAPGIPGKTTYVSEIRNEGLAPVHNLVLKDKIPANMEFVEAEGPRKYKFTAIAKKYNFEKRTVIFDKVDVLWPGQILTYKITCKPLRPGMVKNTSILEVGEFNLKVVQEESTAIKTFCPFQDHGSLMVHSIKIGKVEQFVSESDAKGVFSIGGQLSFTLNYQLGEHKNASLILKSRHSEGNKTEIITEYVAQPSKKTFMRKTYLISEWKPIMILLEGQDKLEQKEYLRIIPRLKKEESPRYTKDLMLHLEKIYFLNMQSKKLIAAGGATGHQISINIVGEGLFEISLQRFSGAERIGILSNNEIGIYSRDNRKKPRYKIIATNTIIGGSKYWVWVKESPPKPGSRVTIEVKSY